MFRTWLLQIDEFQACLYIFSLSHLRSDCNKCSSTEKRTNRLSAPLEPSWVGNNPTSENYSLKEYLEDIADEKKQAPLRELKKMFKNAVNEMKNDINKLKSKHVSVR